jgi:hypothetical protein
MHLLCSERALEVTGNQGVEPAMEWLVILNLFSFASRFNSSFR